MPDCCIKFKIETSPRESASKIEDTAPGKTGSKGGGKR